MDAQLPHEGLEFALAKGRLLLIYTCLEVFAAAIAIFRLSPLSQGMRTDMPAMAFWMSGVGGAVVIACSGAILFGSACVSWRVAKAKWYVLLEGDRMHTWGQIRNSSRARTQDMLVTDIHGAGWGGGKYLEFSVVSSADGHGIPVRSTLSHEPLERVREGVEKWVHQENTLGRGK